MNRLHMRKSGAHMRKYKDQSITERLHSTLLAANIDIRYISKKDNQIHILSIYFVVLYCVLKEKSTFADRN